MARRIEIERTGRMESIEKTRSRIHISEFIWIEIIRAEQNGICYVFARSSGFKMLARIFQPNTKSPHFTHSFVLISIDFKCLNWLNETKNILNAAIISIIILLPFTFLCVHFCHYESIRFLVGIFAARELVKPLSVDKPFCCTLYVHIKYALFTDAQHRMHMCTGDSIWIGLSIARTHIRMSKIN